MTATDQRRWDALLIYNAEVERGLMHTEEYRARMQLEQAEFDRWSEQRLISERRWRA